MEACQSFTSPRSVRRRPESMPPSGRSSTTSRVGRRLRSRTLGPPSTTRLRPKDPASGEVAASEASSSVARSTPTCCGRSSRVDTPRTGEQLVTATGSAGRAQKHRPPITVAATGAGEELLSILQVAALLGTSARYIRKVAAETSATDNASTRARLQVIQDETGAWQFRCDDVERFAATREEPKVVVAYDVTISVEKSILLAGVHADLTHAKSSKPASTPASRLRFTCLEDHALQVRRGRGSEQADGVWAASYRHQLFPCWWALKVIRLRMRRCGVPNKAAAPGRPTNGEPLSAPRPS